MLWITAGVGYLTLEAIAAASFRPPYSYAHNYISDLGVTCGGMIQVASSTLRWPFFLVGAVLVARAVESQKAGLVLSLAATNATGNIVVGIDGGSIAKVDGTAWGYSAGAVMAIAGGNMAILAGSAIVRNAGTPHCTRPEKPTRAPTDAVVISASVARLVGRRVPFVSRT